MTTGYTLTESAHPFTFLVSEDSDGAGYLSRDQVTIAASQTIGVGQILSRTTNTAVATATSAAKSGNAGNGTVALASPAVDATAIGGTYRVVFTDATHFMVEDPTGEILGDGVAGTAFATGVKFTFTAGGTAMSAGDEFLITVDEKGAYQHVAWDGSKPAVAIACYPVVTGSGATAQTTVINNHATVRLSDLVFGGSPTQAQIDQAIHELRLINIKVR